MRADEMRHIVESEMKAKREHIAGWRDVRSRRSLCVHMFLISSRSAMPLMFGAADGTP